MLGRVESASLLMQPGQIIMLSLLAGSAIWGTGCQRYTSLPLTSAVIDRTLAMPTEEELQAAAETLRNPLLGNVAIDLRAGITPASAAVIAVVHNPSLQAERDKVPAADADLLQARILPNPSATLGVDVPVGANSAGEVVGYGLGIEWEITSLLTRGPKINAARASAQQVRLDLVWKEWQVAQAAKQAVYDVVALHEQLAEATALSSRLAKISDRAGVALSHHDLTAVDASAAQSAAAEAKVSLASTRRDLRDAELALNRALGFPPASAVTISSTVVLPSRMQPPESGALLSNLESRRIDLVALRRGYDSQEDTVRAAILGQFPKISLGISHTRDYGDFLTLGPALTIDLPIFDRNQGAIAMARATRQQFFDEYISRVFEARSDVARAVALIASLNDVISAQESQVQSLGPLVDAADRALAQGNVDASTYYVAAVNLSQKQVELMKLRQDLMHARISLELAAGAVLPDGGDSSAKAGGT